MKRKYWIGMLTGGAVLAAGAWTAAAQDFPARPLEVIVGQSAGGSSDLVARAVAKELQDILGQPVLVENKTGASGQIAGAYVAKSQPDGHTMLLLTASSAVQAALSKNNTFDLTKDLTSVGGIATSPLFVVVSSTVGANSVQELLAKAKENPGKISFGSTGVGSIAHVSGELLAKLGDVKLLHVPYKGGSESAVAIMGGEISMSFLTGPQMVPLRDSGKANVVAVTSKERGSSTPEIPTLDESGVKGYDIGLWFGLMVPSATPVPVIETLNKAINEAISRESVKSALAPQHLTITGGPPEAFWSVVESDIARNKTLIEVIDMK